MFEKFKTNEGVLVNSEKVLGRLKTSSEGVLEIFKASEEALERLKTLKGGLEFF